MTVRELMNILKDVNADLEVRFADDFNDNSVEDISVTNEAVTLTNLMFKNVHFER